MDQPFIPVIAGFIAGSMNALAGGGSFVSLPALVAGGMPSVIANATSSLALWPGTIASAAVYRRDLRPVATIPFRAMLCVTLAGGALGAILLLATPGHLFDHLLPWLLLVATIALAVAPHIAPRLRPRAGGHRLPLLAGQFLLGAYGGFYGGATGLMMLALWSLIDGSGIKALAATRTAMVAAANAAAILCFAVAGVIDGPAALLLGGGALAGGYAGARLGRHLPPELIRRATLLLCAATTLIFFLRSYG